MNKHLALPRALEYNKELLDAIRYSVFAGGKRIRPILSIVVKKMLCGDECGIYYPACAIELIHTYSLIHDDLPAIDNDDYRRGKESCHKRYGEATALLAGDGLLTLAFDWLTRGGQESKLILKLIREVSKASGIDGMVGGQVQDVLMTDAKAKEGKTNIHKNENEKNEKMDGLEKRLEYIHKNKTGALIRASVLVGALCGGGTEEDIERLGLLGDKIGLGFQIVDDILDIEGNLKELGKREGKDEAMNKLTYPAYYGLEESKARTSKLLQQSKDLIESYKDNEELKDMLDIMFLRKS